MIAELQNKLTVNKLLALNGSNLFIYLITVTTGQSVVKMPLGIRQLHIVVKKHQ
jgi:hypothetical protein